MALTAKSTFLYGYTVTTDNRNLDFRSVALEPARQAVLNLGYYSLSGLLREVVRAITEVDPTVAYTATADRTLLAGLANRITITSTSGTLFQLLFATGPNAATSCASLLGFLASDYTGALTYTGSNSTGTYVVPNANDTGIFGYNFVRPSFQPKVTGSLNIAASGEKEEVIFNIQNFWNVEFKHISTSEAVNSWVDLITWMIQARPLEFTPEVSSPTDYYEGTLETSSADGKGMAFLLKEQLPQFPNTYQTGPMKFRQRLST